MDLDKLENIKEADTRIKNKIKLDLCIKCYSNNNFPNTYTSDDF